jgi:regulator of replication initiation timing
VKEVRKARKEAFKSASVVLKLQETLRDTQKRLQVSKIDHATDVQKADQFEQEATDAKCALMALQQDLGKLREQFAVLEQENEALKTNLKEEEVARIAAEGQIALPSGHDDDSDLFSSPQKPASPRKSQLEPLSDDKENVGVVTKKMFDTRKLQEELEAERLKKMAAEELVEFLRMECAFKCCECKSASRHGRALRVSMDEILASSIQKMKGDIASIMTPPASESGEDQMDAENTHTAAGAEDSASTDPQETNPADEVDHEMGEDASEAPLPDHVQDTTTVVDETVEDEATRARQATPENDSELAHSLSQHNDDTTESIYFNIQDEQSAASHHTTTVPLKDSPPSTPPRAQLESELNDQIQRSVRTITTTTRIPMHFTPVSKPALLPPWEQENTEPRKFGSTSSSGEVSALPFDREAALAAIAYRRGRAKSIANGTLTPPRQMVEGINLKSRRDVSAPVIGTKEYAEKMGSMSAGKALRA